MAHGYFGNPYRGMLRTIIRLARENPDAPFRTVDMTDRVLPLHPRTARGKTPERTVNSYCSQNPKIFSWVTDDTYRLTPEWREGPV